ncbi:MAG: hypothetical protein COV72_04190 [Candidatus Omnitrophica bacterium CG11_big_fil_rev_8_21_14_0_20_42_13]|uniref:DUF2621 domain-containing protein n=1 Tax=Candidatus Ghiorseimicrobium undicola TaxID=1974746 RepID=A0A2H0LXV6_9BACT|nr:MAG: hypothetical protein COV72_04190 [Candidatus Omnitrophica bacterium CG11_big_fil_rev_8_21_14_0_20_42_13]
MNWDKTTQDKFKQMIEKIPVFHRRITESVVTKKAEKNAASRNAAEVEEQDVISAFFSDVPSPFYGMMVRLLEKSGFDYKKYGYPKE